ncbi:MULTISPECIES: glutaredoxin 3 [Acidiphilium]|jgi:glutaredoxin 3|uniref:Glutaredoxin n=2 Tax=Acidiphilium TaxID=522 RepID=A5FYM2_ACICJ|nr:MULTISPECIES: glutaredoxin 3 [Acidiphilium]MBU6355362.1 glutaredoxin 3 [Rhodospirillales bacterium]ABQ30704.1 glutaredoxin 3 [Acidiphilium cryptum JF-5]MBS3022638.1 glutaredoxin 3 [Acidiphilium multivorum]MDE2326386.1 glutaredoxin 3 [Rhodospirillales bacterium]UNC15251.1 glutaredoxin 3 [Acidiphilium multivorum]
MPTVEIYTQAFCPYCSRAVRLMREKGVPFTEIDAPRGSAARREAIERSGGSTTVPQIFIDGQSIGGCDELLELERTGRLDPLLAA